MSIGIKAASAAARGITASRPGVGSLRPIPRGAPRGDPGIFGDIWGGIKGAISGAIKGATGQRDTVFTSTPQLPPMMTLPISVQGRTAMPRPPQQIPEPGFVPFIERLVPGGATGMMQDPSYQAGKASSPGYHWNKTGYFLKDGTWVEKGTKQVKNRRRNPLNPRALDRSMSRITSAKRASKKLGRITIRAAKSCR